MRTSGTAADNRRTLSNPGLHLIDDELREDWIDSWVTEGISEVESYLGKYAAFDAFLDGAAD
jgi:hypothetical protein